MNRITEAKEILDALMTIWKITHEWAWLDEEKIVIESDKIYDALSEWWLRYMHHDYSQKAFSGEDLQFLGRFLIRRSQPRSSTNGV